MSETSRGDTVHVIETPGTATAEAARPAGQSLTTRVQVPESGIGPTHIVFEYSTLPGNQPNTYGNTVFLWQTSSSVVPVGVSPIASSVIASNQQTGSALLSATVSTSSYLLAYATGPRVENVCATAFIPASGPGESQSPAITVAGMGPTWLSYAYSLPPGLQPASAGHWVGLWQGQGGLYSVPPLAFAPVPQNTSSGEGVLQGLTLRFGTQYTLVYFAGGYAAARPAQTTAACSITFTT
jgi:hypothetical protein